MQWKVVHVHRHSQGPQWLEREEKQLWYAQTSSEGEREWYLKGRKEGGREREREECLAGSTLGACWQLHGRVNESMYIILCTCIWWCCTVAVAIISLLTKLVTWECMELGHIWQQFWKELKQNPTLSHLTRGIHVSWVQNFSLHRNLHDMLYLLSPLGSWRAVAWR